MKTVKELTQAIDNRKANSAWARGVKQYAHDLLSDLDPETHLDGSTGTIDTLLNGAETWKQYSDSGCTLICDYQIAERLCTPSELEKTLGGDRRPNRHETWLDVQSRALHQACKIICHEAR